MRMKELKISDNGDIKLDIINSSTNYAVIVSGGQAKVTELPRYAETKIITHDGRVTRVEWDEGEKF